MEYLWRKKITVDQNLIEFKGLVNMVWDWVVLFELIYNIYMYMYMHMLDGVIMGAFLPHVCCFYFWKFIVIGAVACHFPPLPPSKNTCTHISQRCCIHAKGVLKYEDAMVYWCDTLDSHHQGLGSMAQPLPGKCIVPQCDDTFSTLLLYDNKCIAVGVENVIVVECMKCMPVNMARCYMDTAPTSWSYPYDKNLIFPLENMMPYNHPQWPWEIVYSEAFWYGLEWFYQKLNYQKGEKLSKFLIQCKGIWGEIAMRACNDQLAHLIIHKDWSQKGFLKKSWN